MARIAGCEVKTVGSWQIQVDMAQLGNFFLSGREKKRAAGAARTRTRTRVREGAQVYARATFRGGLLLRWAGYC